MATLEYEDFAQFERMLCSASCALHVSIGRFVRALTLGPGPQWDASGILQQLTALHARGFVILRALTKQTNVRWVQRVNLQLSTSVSRGCIEFVDRTPMIIVFVNPGFGHIDRLQSLRNYRWAMRSHVSGCIADVIGNAVRGCGADIRAACFTAHADSPLLRYVPRCRVPEYFVVVASMLHGRLGSQSPGHCLNSDCVSYICELLFETSQQENAGVLLPWARG